MNSNIYAKCAARTQSESVGCFSCPYESSIPQLMCEFNIEVMHNLTRAKCLPAALQLRPPEDSGLGRLTAVIHDRLLALRLHSNHLSESVTSLSKTRSAP